MSRVRNELGGREKTARSEGPFRLLTVVIIFLIGLFGFAAATVMSGYAEDLEPKDRRGAHAQSQSAIGYGGLRDLARASGRDVSVSRKIELEWTQSIDVRVFTLDAPFDLSKLSDYDLSTNPTLVVLPKWDVEPLRRDSERPSDVWVQKPARHDGLYDVGRIGRSGRDAPHKLWINRDEDKTRFTITEGLGFNGIAIEVEALQYLGLPLADEDISLEDLSLEEAIEQIEELSEEAKPTEDSYVKNRREDMSVENQSRRLSAAAGKDDAVGYVPELIIDGHPVLFTLQEYGDAKYHVLTEPDLLNTQGLSSPDRAELALTILDHVADHSGFEDAPIRFDLTLHGYGSNTNIIKTLTQPPFLAATLCLLAAMALVIWRGFVRFGDPREEVTGLALGKRTLIENGARLIRLARRPTAISDDYVRLKERQLISALRLGGAREAKVDAVIAARESALSKEGESGTDFKTLAAQVERANDAPSLVQAARKLHDKHDQLSSPS